MGCSRDCTPIVHREVPLTGPLGPSSAHQLNDTCSQAPSDLAPLTMRGCSTELVPAFLRLLRDGEAEVRIAAASKVAAFCKLLPGPQIAAQVSAGGKQLAGCVHGLACLQIWVVGGCLHLSWALVMRSGKEGCGATSHLQHTLCTPLAVRRCRGA